MGARTAGDENILAFLLRRSQHACSIHICRAGLEPSTFRLYIRSFVSMLVVSVYAEKSSTTQQEILPSLYRIPLHFDAGIGNNGHFMRP